VALDVISPQIKTIPVFVTVSANQRIEIVGIRERRDSSWEEGVSSRACQFGNGKSRVQKVMRSRTGSLE
jgi:hypothetical protein